MDFPNSPSVGTTASNGASTWTWNGKQWDITGSAGGGGGIAEAPVDTLAYGRKDAAWAKVVKISGDQMTGPLGLPADPTTALQAATKQYVDNKSPVGLGTLSTMDWTCDDTAPSGPISGDRWVKPATGEEMVWVPATPSGGVSTWNPADKAAGITLSQGNLRATSTASLSSVRATTGKSTGKWQFELTALSNGSWLVGLATLAANLTDYPGQSSAGYAYHSGTGNKYNGSGGVTYGPSYTNGDVIGVTIDFATLAIVFYKNGATLGTAFTLAAGTYYPIIGVASAIAPLGDLNTGDSPFAYPVAGFSAWGGSGSGGGGGAWMNPSSAAFPLPLSVANGGTSGTTQATALAGLGIPRHNLLDVQDIAPHNVLRITAAGGLAALQLNKAAGANSNFLQGLMATKPRWLIYLGDSTAESGSNAGSDFSIWRYDDAGNAIGQALGINRATGEARFLGLAVEGVAGSWRSINFYTSPTKARWSIATDGGAETGSNAGSDFKIYRSNDAGGLLDATLSIYRSTGNAAFSSELKGNTLYSTYGGNIGPDLLSRGNAYKPGGGVWGDSSDKRIKDDIADYTQGLAAVLALRPRTFRFKALTGRDTTKTYVGLVAQEVEDVMPEMVSLREKKFPEDVDDTREVSIFKDMRTLDTTALIYALVNAVKELAQRVQALEAA